MGEGEGVLDVSEIVSEKKIESASCKCGFHAVNMNLSKVYYYYLFIFIHFFHFLPYFLPNVYYF